ncbi:hypothetical protein BT69DRAFT_1304884, partial [Atractiella rhizophila]
NLTSNLGGIGGHFGLHGSSSDSDIHAVDRSRARDHSDFDLRHRQPVVQSTTGPPSPNTRSGRELSLEELNNALLRLIDNNRFLQRSDLVGLMAFARSHIAIRLTSIYATQVGLQRQFADLVDKFVVSWETPKIIEDYMLERERNGMMLLSLESLWKNQTMTKKVMERIDHHAEQKRSKLKELLVKSMDPNAAGGVKNIVDLTVEIVKGYPDISASKELQGQYAFLRGGLRGKWGEAPKIAGKEFWNEGDRRLQGIVTGRCVETGRRGLSGSGNVMDKGNNCARIRIQSVNDQDKLYSEKGKQESSNAMLLSALAAAPVDITGFLKTATDRKHQLRSCKARACLLQHALPFWSSLH